ncbi:MAG: THUMP domain-containing protein [Nitrososphaerota archaeon]|nr:THUMP domain-containing protein [Candidatus Bathyarchaeota archaeon]MDW8061415.1 THUMP domain-containing protein [Nitrososphaerota archaeon]
MRELRVFNLIVTCPRGAEFDAVYGIKDLLSEVGDSEAEAWETDVSGLILARTRLDPIEAARRIRDYVKVNPDRVGVVRRIIPIQRCVQSKIEAIVDAVKDLKDIIRYEEKFRITIEKRHTQLGSREIIAETAKLIDRKVDLENPDKIVLIEVVGPVTGISVLKPSDIVNLEREVGGVE